VTGVLPSPIIDLRSSTPQSVERALTQSGFMYVLGHGIDPMLVERAFGAMKRFFEEPREFKDAYAYTDIDANFGYQGVGVERLDPGSMPDMKESFTMRNALLRADQIERWPQGDFRDIALAFYTAGLGAAYRIMEVIAACLSLPADFFALRHRGENVTLRFLHYPAGLRARSSAQLGAGAHTDYGSITLLFQDEVGGLELLGTDGTWRAVPPIDGAAVINSGDLMERWTNGRFRSTVHRVRPMAGDRDRYSIALFVDPDAAVEVECFESCITTDRPLRFPRITAGEHIRQKIAATHKGLK
jgi:isopenicillin N synthase-like dioxygenase